MRKFLLGVLMSLFVAAPSVAIDDPVISESDPTTVRSHDMRRWWFVDWPNVAGASYYNTYLNGKLLNSATFSHMSLYPYAVPPDGDALDYTGSACQICDYVLTFEVEAVDPNGVKSNKDSATLAWADPNTTLSTLASEINLLMVNFKDYTYQPLTKAFAQSRLDEALSRLNTESSGHLSLTGTAYGWFTLDNSISEFCQDPPDPDDPEGNWLRCNGGSIFTTADDLAISLGIYDPNTPGEDLMILVVAGYPNTGSSLIIAGANTFKFSGTHTIIHEVGHNLGLTHASSWSPPTVGGFLTDLSCGSVGQDLVNFIEGDTGNGYADSFDWMGGVSYDPNAPPSGPTDGLNPFDPNQDMSLLYPLGKFSALNRAIVGWDDKMVIVPQTPYFRTIENGEYVEKYLPAEVWLDDLLDPNNATNLELRIPIDTGDVETYDQYFYSFEYRSNIGVIGRLHFSREGATLGGATTLLLYPASPDGGTDTTDGLRLSTVGKFFEDTCREMKVTLTEIDTVNNRAKVSVIRPDRSRDTGPPVEP